MLNHSFKFIISFLLLTFQSTAQEQEPEELLFKPSQHVKTMKTADFDKKALSRSKFTKLLQKHKVPRNYIFKADTLPDPAVSLVLEVHGRHARQMIAYRTEKNVTLFEVMSPTLSASTSEMKSDKDITGDGVNEVFVYYTQHYSRSHSFGDSEGSSTYLEIWDPVKQLKLLDQKISSDGRGWNMCTGKSGSYSNFKKYNFFKGGFSITETTYIRKEGEEDRDITKKGPVYSYTTNGFILNKNKD